MGGTIMVDKTQEILATIFNSNVDTFKDQKAKERIKGFLQYLKDEEGYDGLNYSVFVKDLKTEKWKNKSHFYKVFYDELDYVMEKYLVTQNEIDFLCRLGKYLLWEINLIVDEENIPLNQKELAIKMNMSIRQLQRYMNELIKKKCIVSIRNKNESFYLVNPYLLFTGQKINMSIPKLFDIIGYSDSGRSNRERRHKKVTKRTKIKDLDEMEDDKNVM
jgi:hypothetical protein